MTASEASGARETRDPHQAAHSGEASDDLRDEVARLVRELESAEAYEQKLRQVIIDVRDRLAAGRVGEAQSLLNQALNDIDCATDVVTSRRNPKEDR